MFIPTRAAEIPITQGRPDQTATVTLSGKLYRIRVVWNAVSAAWYCRIWDDAGTVSIPAFKLVTGKELLLHRGVAGLGYLMVSDSEGKGEDPTFSGFGSRFKLQYFY